MPGVAIVTKHVPSRQSLDVVGDAFPSKGANQTMFLDVYYESHPLLSQAGRLSGNHTHKV